VSPAEAVKEVLLTTCIKADEIYFQGNTVITGEDHATRVAKQITERLGLK
jgi:hypothetical protein